MKKHLLFSLIALVTVTMLHAQDIEKNFPFVMGNLRFSKNYSVFPDLKNTQTKFDTIRIYNMWDKAMTFEFKDIMHMKYLNCQAIPAKLNPGKEGIIVLKLDGTQVPNFGFNNMSLGIYTNDTNQTIKRMTLSINLTEDFSKLTPAQLANAPKISFNTTKYDFGTIKSGDAVKYSYQLTNTGKSELIIRRTSASCGCTASNPAKQNLAPGESTTIDINFNTSGRTGRQIKTVTVVSNDPANPSIVLTVEGTLE